MDEHQQETGPSAELNPVVGHPPLWRTRDVTTTRRRVIAWLIRVSLVAFALAFALPAVALRALKQNVEGIATGDKLVYATGSNQGSLVDTTAMKPDTAIHAFPQGKTNDSNNLVELVHLKSGSPDFVAYSAICTHLGCSVLTTLTADGDIPCPCHGSVFNPADGAKVVAGPAPRSLPSLPIKVESDGTVVVTGPFNGKIGPD
ncbi:MAG TPA: Rieske (2Fe-2S) protein [Thermomicrobiales bacterium]|nr:Rieske (2Fe-2S) protein [Thermomicrobiales bacterium]